MWKFNVANTLFEVGYCNSVMFYKIEQTFAFSRYKANQCSRQRQFLRQIALLLLKYMLMYYYYNRLLLLIEIG